MKHILFLYLSLPAFTLMAHSQANTALSNLVPTTVNQSLRPQLSYSISLGSPSRVWLNLYLGESIYLGGVRFISNPGTSNSFFGAYSGPSLLSGSYNLGVGDFALSHLTKGNYNTANGAYALYFDSTGTDNTASGAYALYSNRSGNSNAAHGGRALYYNSTGRYNTASGSRALHDNTTGENNTANGASALYGNKTGVNNTANGARALYFSNGSGNTAYGYESLYKNSSGSFNTGVGQNALNNNTLGSYNTAVGLYALYTLNGGRYNTAIGVGAGDITTAPSHSTFLGAGTRAGSSLFNVTAIGYDALATASNQVMLGNTSISSVRAAGGFVIMSDGRFKSKPEENVPGLDFIRDLRPVTYHYNITKLNKFLKQGGNKSAAGGRQVNSESAEEQEAITRKEKKLYTGFIAQEVEATAKKLKYEFSGVYTPENEGDTYGLSYAEFVVPLVKAVQELDAKTKEIDELKKKNEQLEQRLQRLENLITSGNARQNISGAFLEVISSNPFSNTVQIRYGLPVGSKAARIDVLNMKGQVVKSIALSGRSREQVTIYTNNLAAGSYVYTLWVDGHKVDSKQLLIAR